MKEVIISADNVLVKTEVFKSAITLPDNEKEKLLKKIVNKLEVVGFGDKAKENFPEIEVGNEILVVGARNINPVNMQLGLQMPDDSDEKYLYFFIKAFEIIAIIE
jgi:co-chaperonin GroES (HSP10)